MDEQAFKGMRILYRDEHVICESETGTKNKLEQECFNGVLKFT
jgi:hypothetical protein